jgi:triacylglycerol lipase
MFKFFAIIFLSFAQLSIFGSYKIFVIHGYGSSRVMMKKIDKSIRNENYITENYAYKSMTDDLDTIGKQLYVRIKTATFDTVSFVTHSMGALVVRSMLNYAKNDKDFPVIYRIVMIAPPNGGAEIADIYASYEILRELLGPNLEHMKTDSGSYANKLPIPYNSEIGIIAGIRGGKYGYNLLIKGDNDGLLTPKRTKLGVQKDFVLIKGEHNLLTQKKYVCKLVVEFLKFGLFKSKENQL